MITLKEPEHVAVTIRTRTPLWFGDINKMADEGVHDAWFNGQPALVVGESSHGVCQRASEIFGICPGAIRLTPGRRYSERRDTDGSFV